MPYRSRRSLSTRTALYVVGVCLSLITLEAWREYSSRQAAVELTHEQMSNIARSLIQHADDTFEAGQVQLALGVEALEKGGTGEDNLETVRKMMATSIEASSRISELAVLNAEGNWLVSTSNRLNPRENFSDRAYFKYHKASASRGYYFGPPVISRISGQPILTLTRRFDNADGSFGGVILAGVNARYFSHFYESFDLGKKGLVALTTNQGILLSSAPFNLSAVGSDHSANPIFSELIPNAPNGEFTMAPEFDHVQRLGWYEMSTLYPVVAIAGISETDALAGWWGETLWRGSATAIFVLVLGIFGLRMSDQIFKRQQSELSLAHKEAEFRLIAENAGDLVERLDNEGTRLYVSPSSLRVLGVPRDDMIGQSAFERLHPDDMPEVIKAARRLQKNESVEETISFRTQHGDGREIWLETSLRIARDNGQMNGAIAVTRDITARKRLELKLEEMAMVDGLTSLANRRAFDTTFESEFRRARRERYDLSLLLIDIDRFKFFNDTYGHLGGDSCLRRVAEVIAGHANRPGDFVARYGGEEIVVLLPQTPLSGAQYIAGEILRKVQALAIAHEHNLPWGVVTVSVGVATLLNQPGARTAAPDDLVEAADAALYEAKATGRNRFCVGLDPEGGKIAV